MCLFFWGLQNYMCFPNPFFLASPEAWESPWAGDRTCATAAIRATAVKMLCPKPLPSRCSQRYLFFKPHYYYYFQVCTGGPWEFPGQGSNQSCSCWPTPQPQQRRIQASSVTCTTQLTAVVGPLTHCEPRAGTSSDLFPLSHRGSSLKQSYLFTVFSHITHPEGTLWTYYCVSDKKLIKYMLNSFSWSQQDNTGMQISHGQGLKDSHLKSEHIYKCIFITTCLVLK